MHQVQSSLQAAVPSSHVEASVVELDDEQLGVVCGGVIPVGGWGPIEVSTIPVGGW
jgi:hypothetical protein